MMDHHMLEIDHINGFKHTYEGMSSSDKVKVAVYSGSLEANVTGLIREIRERMSDYVEDVKFVKLPYNVRDMLKINLEKDYYMLLCHSINNRGFSITNVPNALYDDFLRKARKKLQQHRIGVIAHDFDASELSDDILANRMQSFKVVQERTFRKSALQLIGGQLSQSPVQLNDDQWQKLKNFVRYRPPNNVPFMYFWLE